MDVTIPARDLFAHMEWADAAIWRAVVSSPGAAADRRCFELLQHYSLTQRAFFDLWRGVELDLATIGATLPPDLAALAPVVREWYRALFEWLGAGQGAGAGQGVPAGRFAGAGGPRGSRGPDPADEASLRQPLPVPWAAQLEQRLGRAPAPSTVAETMMQVAMHSAHHRAQVSARLRELGCEPPTVDFILWVWLGKPAAEWRRA